MQFIKPDISTICVGIAMSMGSLLLTGGAKGKRFSLPNSRILIHQPSAGFEGQSTDIEIHAREILNIRKRTDEIYAHHTGQTEEQVHIDMERDRFFKPDEAVDVRADRPRDRQALRPRHPPASRPAARSRAQGRLGGGAPLRRVGRRASRAPASSRAASRASAARISVLSSATSISTVWPSPSITSLSIQLGSRGTSQLRGLRGRGRRRDRREPHRMGDAAAVA